jgi:hypothetical protein
MQGEQVFCTNIDDLSASSFGCRIKEASPASQQITRHDLISSPYGKASYHQSRSFSDFSLKRA